MNNDWLEYMDDKWNDKNHQDNTQYKINRKKAKPKE